MDWAVVNARGLRWLTAGAPVPARVKVAQGSGSARSELKNCKVTHKVHKTAESETFYRTFEATERTLKEGMCDGWTQVHRPGTGYSFQQICQNEGWGNLVKTKSGVKCLMRKHITDLSLLNKQPCLGRNGV